MESESACPPQNEKILQNNDLQLEKSEEGNDTSDVQSSPESMPFKAKIGNSDFLYKDSEKTLKKLCADGKELINNVAISAQIESADRRLKAHQEQASRADFLLSQQTQCQEQLNEIISKWESASNTKVPQKLKKLLVNLKVECENHLKAKDAVISKLKNDINQKNEEFNLARSMQEEEIDLMNQRLRDFISDLHKASDDELKLIQHTLEKIRVETMARIAKGMDGCLENKETSNKRYDDFYSNTWRETRKLQETRRIQHNELATLRKQLEQDAHDFLIQLKNAEAVQFLNLDKLKYGLYIMQQQVKENKVLSCDMKRFNIQAFDHVLVLRAYLKKIDKEGEKAFLKEVEYIEKNKKKLVDDIKVAKDHHGFQSNLFSAVFKEREKEILKLFNKILATDKFIFETLLQIEWKPPDISFLDHKKVETESNEKELRKWLEFFIKESAKTNSSDNIVYPKTNEETEALFYVRHPLDIEKLLEFICCELDFLINKKALELAKTVFSDWKTFVLSNSVFNAVGIKTCENLNNFMAHVLSKAKKLNGKEDLVLSSREVLIGFRDYISLQKKKTDFDEVTFDIQPITDMRKEPEFWEPYAKIMSSGREMLWDAVIEGLEKHLDASETLFELSQKKFRLLQQQQELQQLLQKPQNTDE